MKKWFVELTEKDLSKMPHIVGLSFFVLAIISFILMLSITLGIREFGLNEIVPVWILQISVMLPWVAFIGLIIFAIIACIGLMIIDMSIHKNFDEYKDAFQFWKENDSNEEFSAEIFGSQR